MLSALIEGKNGGKAEVRLRTEGAAFIPVYFSVQNVVLNGAECHCIIATDLSEQKRHEEIAAVLEAVPAGIFIARDAECRSIVGNRMAYELLRLPPTANVSKSALELEKMKYKASKREVRDGRDVPAEELPMPRLPRRTGQRVFDYEFDMLFDDGAFRCWLGNAVPLFDERGRARGAVGAFVDITERKRAAEALRTANAELRNFGNALTQDIQQPLAMVVRFTQLLAQEYRGKLGANAESYISDALGGALKIESLLKALLHYWEITERSGLSLSPVDCNRVLSQALLHLNAAIRQSGAAVTAEPLPTVVAEDVMLEQLFETLVDNSIQYRSEAVPRIHISVARISDRWLFSVRDNGIGIDPENSALVFEMFRRLHGNEIPGSGIGLALCKKIVERHGGRIWVESETGRGRGVQIHDSHLPGFCPSGVFGDWATPRLSRFQKPPLRCGRGSHKLMSRDRKGPRQQKFTACGPCGAISVPLFLRRALPPHVRERPHAVERQRVGERLHAGGGCMGRLRSRTARSAASGTGDLPGLLRAGCVCLLRLGLWCNGMRGGRCDRMCGGSGLMRLRLRRARCRACCHFALRFGAAISRRCGPGGCSVGGLSVIFGGRSCLGLTAGRRFLLRSWSGSGLAVLPRHRRFRRAGPRCGSAGSAVKTRPITPVAYVLDIGVMNDRRIHVHHRGVIGKVPAFPTAAVESSSAVAEAIVHAAIEAHGRSPVAGIKRIESIRKTPIARCPEEAGLRRRYPRTGDPVIACVAIAPVARLPKVSVGWTQRLLVNL